MFTEKIKQRFSAVDPDMFFIFIIFILYFHEMISKV